MSQIDRRALRLQFQREFPDLELTDWYVQYRGLKAGNPDAVLFYRMGDFYETFDDDAKLAANLLGVTLTYKKFATIRGTKTDKKCPMAGMPYHAVEKYVTAFVGAGYRVAIAEQMSETASSKSDTRPRSVFASGLEHASSVKGMVDREVVRVITPGTLTDANLLAAEQNNYLAALIIDGERVGLAYADLSTGEFAATEFTGQRAAIQAQGELARLRAAEVLVSDAPEQRISGLEAVSARLERDLEFMTKEERELLLPGERVARRVERENTARWAHGHVTAWPAWRWELRTARDALIQQFAVRSLAGFGLSDRPLAIRAAGALLQYAQATQNGATAQLLAIRTYTPGDVMFLDPQTRRNLELLEGSGGKAKGSLISVLDQSRTPMGARLLRRWVSQPLIDIPRLTARQNAVAHFADDTLLRATIRDRLKQIGDMERVVNRVIQGVTMTTPRDMARLRDALRVLPQIAEALDGWLPDQVIPPQAPVGAADDPDDWSDEPPPIEEHPAEPRTASLREQREARRHVQARHTDDDLFGEDDGEEPPAPRQRPSAAVNRPAPVERIAAPPDDISQIDPCADVLDLLEAALDEEPPALLGASNYLRSVEENGEKPRRVIRPGFEPAMDAVVQATREAHNWISALEAREQQRTGIKSLRVDYNKVFGYYIEVARTFADQVPSDYIRKQTLTTGERYITPKLKEYEDVVLTAQQRLVDLERAAFGRICAEVAAQGTRLLSTARLLAEVDVFAALAEAAVRGRYARPTLYDDTRLRITAGRHPVVEQSLDESFIANDASLDTEEQQILLITGPNMAGKSTTLRQVALIVLMAQVGSFVPADNAEIGMVDRIFTRIGAQDDIATGQSTFMVEMTETAALLAQSSRRSLIILDEVGRGTSTYDGMAIARAVVEYIHNEPRLTCRTLFATHYHELTELENLLPRVKNYHMAAVERESRVVFLHELRRGRADRSYGIHVAELAGIPRAVIRRAGELLAELESRDHGSVRAEPERPAPRTQRQERGGQLSLFDTASGPLVEMIRRLNVNELTPIEALTKLYELQRLANQ